MKFGLKLFLAYFAILGLGTYFFINSMLLEIKPGLRQSLETALVDTANILAELVSPQDSTSSLRIDQLKPAISKTLQRPINASIWSHQKSRTELRVYVTDHNGIVIYDSSNRDVGANYSQWNDVYLTLRGQYGARSTQENPEDKFSSIMYIGAPIYRPTEKGDKQIAGVLTVGKANVSVEPFWQIARDNIRSKGMWLLVAAALAGALLATWLSLSIHRLVEYTRKISQGESYPPPKLSDPDLAQLADAMEDMRKALDGKEYIESYTLSLTHEMKSPLTALHGAAELISVVQEPEMREQLADNISQQTERLRALVDQVLALARLENLKVLKQTESIHLPTLIQAETKQLTFRFQEKGIELQTDIEDIWVNGDPLLLGQAVRNLLENALDFSPYDSLISIDAKQIDDQISLCITDQGCGIPEYAQAKIWDKFYSLPRPESGQKSTGLGLSFVQIIAQLHLAQVTLSNADNQGTKALLILPCTPDADS